MTMLSHRRKRIILAIGLVVLAMAGWWRVRQARAKPPEGELVTDQLIIETEDWHYVILVGSRIMKFPVAREPDPIYTIKVRVSHYWPMYGTVNCSDFRDGYCHSKMASGQRWEDWIYKQPGAAACVADWPFGTEFVLPDGSRWICHDRGSSVTQWGGPPWVDLLEPSARYPYGTIVDAKVYD